MRSSVKIIRFTACLSLIFLIMTYAVCLNMEIGFIQLNSIAFSNNFFLTLFGGVFASILVVFTCELQKYYTLKKEKETTFYNLLCDIYSELNMIETFLRSFLAHPNKALSANDFDFVKDYFERTLKKIDEIDYFSFTKNKPHHCYWKFIQETMFELYEYQRNFYYYRQAVCIDQNRLFHSGINVKPVTSTSPDTNRVIQILCILCKISKSKQAELEKVIIEFNKACKNKFDYKKDLTLYCENDCEPMYSGYEDFIKTNI